MSIETVIHGEAERNFTNFKLPPEVVEAMSLQPGNNLNIFSIVGANDVPRIMIAKTTESSVGSLEVGVDKIFHGLCTANSFFFLHINDDAWSKVAISRLDKFYIITRRSEKGNVGLFLVGSRKIKEYKDRKRQSEESFGGIIVEKLKRSRPPVLHQSKDLDEPVSKKKPVSRSAKRPGQTVRPS